MDTTSSQSLEQLKAQIIQHPDNVQFQKLGWEPLFWASPTSRIVLISQAPGALAQAKNEAWRDQSGKVLRHWLGLSNEEFYDPSLTTVMPMDFYFPGAGKQGDLPPRADFAGKWHPTILKLLPKNNLKILIGAYAQRYYLHSRGRFSLTENVLNFKVFLPDFFPLPHPSGRNGPWLAKNPWFKTEVLPTLLE